MGRSPEKHAARIARLGRQALATGVLAVAALGFASPSQALPGPPDEGLPNVDLRATERAPVPADIRAARMDLAEDLGPLGEVQVDRKSGGVAYVGRSDKLLTAPSSLSAQEIVLEYVRAHDEVFGLDERDVANLELVARSVSPDGIAHLRFNQALGGILSFDSGIDGHVTADGRLINVSGAPVPGARLPDADPALGARDGLREAREAVHGAESLPATTKASATPGRTTTFAGGERAVLRWSAAADGPRLAWSVIAADGGDRFYDVLVDAESGALLRRQDLTSDLGEARYFGADPLQTPDPIEIMMPPAWYDEHAGGTRLWGQYARTYVDGSNQSPAPGEEEGGERVQIPASSGAPAAPDWLYEQSTDFPGAKPCPLSGCTWNNEDEDEEEEESEKINQFQAGTNAHVVVSRFHDYLEQAPIGFDEASGNFQRTNTSGSGIGNDYVRVEVNDGGGRNNANFFSPPDGIAPRMQMYLRTTVDVNSSDQADVIYHEYGHGLSSRLVVNASGSSALTGFQSRMMGEGWSDFYSLDLLVHEGHIPDTPAPGEVQIGYYANSPGGVRYKPIDCPVNATETTAACNEASVGLVRGGYTYGDIVPMYRSLTNPPFAPLYNEGPHDGSEIWGETLWDIRAALGRETALALITGGMRLSVDGPSMLDMRDAILQQAVAMRSAPGAPDDHYEALWEIFAKRGMGADATTRSAGSTTPNEGFGLVASAGPPTFTDPYPGGDEDGAIEPGEQFEISQELRAVTSADVDDVVGTLTGGTIVDGTAAWPPLGGDREAANEDPLAARLPAACLQSTLTLSLSSTKGASKMRYVVDKRPGSSETVALADAAGAVPGVTTSSYEALGSGNVTDVDLRIGDLRHARTDQLKVELIHDGVTATIFDGIPWAGQEMVDLIFDSDSASAIYEALGPGTMTGRRQPQAQNALDAFNGHPVAGTWTLRVTDDQEGAAGELRQWGIASPQQACPSRLEIPVAQAKAASGIEQDAATLNGAVTPNGRETALRFAFGATDAYGEMSPIASVGAGDQPVSESFQLTGLQPGTIYHYRVEAIREGGQVAVVSADRTLTTASVPGPPAIDPPVIAPPPVIDPPVIDRAPEISEARVALARAGKHKDRRRASFSFTASEPVAVTAAVARATPGIRDGGRCVAPPKHRPRGRSCTRLLPAARGTVELPAAGQGTLRLSAAGLGKGSYVATLTAVDAAGNASTPVVVRFAVN